MCLKHHTISGIDRKSRFSVKLKHEEQTQKNIIELEVPGLEMLCYPEGAVSVSLSLCASRSQL